MQQRLLSRSVLALGLLGVLGIVSLTIACKGGEGGEADAGKSAGKADPPAKTDGGDAGAILDTGKPTPEPNEEPVASGGPEAADETGPVGAPEVEAPPEPVVDIPALLAKAKDLKTSDEDAIKALDEAMAAKADKIEAAKLANARGEALFGKGEGDRAPTFYEWAKDTHTLYAEPVFNLAKMACLAGEADECKELLLEVKKRGNKKLLKRVGTELEFAPVQDDPEVRKLYE